MSLEKYQNNGLNTLAICLGIVAIGFNTSAPAAEPCEQVAGHVVSLQGSATSGPDELAQGHPVCAGEVISVGSNSRAGIRLSTTQTVIRIDSNTEFTVQPSEVHSTFIDLLRGAIFLFTRQPEKFSIGTPYTNAVVEGTEFVVSVQDNTSLVTVMEGQVRVGSAHGAVVLDSGSSAIATAQSAPTRRVMINPFETVQWAMYYPRVTVDNDASTLSRQAAELLAHGDVKSASNRLTQALRNDDNDVTALALESLVLTVLGNKSLARERALQAVAAHNNSAIAYSALSYSQQADFKLDEALNSAEFATELQSDNAEHWARLAELQTAQGDLRAARNSARRASELDPDLSRTHSVLGFVELARNNAFEASSAFDRAIEADSTDPLARLGKGLSAIRHHDVELGREQIEIAATLDPGNSLIRSYLGKSYYNEERYELATEQFELAKQLDAADPTPWFYAAIQSQALNRPVIALTELRESISRNDNRAVYRSRLDLDADLSSREVRQGLVYSDLGFEQAALNESWKSIARSPRAFSAHQLAADSYLGIPRHRFARNSELLQAQMLQPIGLAPVASQLGSSGLSLLNDTSQGKSGLNEFSRLFVEDDLVLITSVAGGTQSTLAEELIVAGVGESSSFSVGQSWFRTDGIRENNELTRNTLSLFGQYAPRFDTSVQIEYRRIQSDAGDRTSLFNAEFFSDVNETQNEDGSVRFGLRHDLSHRQTILFGHAEFDGTTELNALNANGDVFHDYETNQKLGSSELRHIFESSNFNVSSGVSVTSGDTTQGGVFGEILYPSRSSDTRFRSIYSYFDFNIRPDLLLTLGASDAHVDSIGVNYSRLNPKLGVLWTPSPGTTVRGAYFESMKQPYTADQTLEPVSVAGFNQVFNDPSASRSRRYGLGVDRWIGSRLSAGFEVSKRMIAIPYVATNPFAHDEETLTRAHLYWLAGDRVALSAEATLEKFDLELDPELNYLPSESFSQMRLLRLPIELRYFQPNGFFALIRSTYVQQDGLFETVEEYDVPADVEFVVVDLEMGYRLPRQLGRIRLEIRNLLDKDFRFQDGRRQDLADEDVPTIAPVRQIYANAIFNF